MKSKALTPPLRFSKFTKHWGEYRFDELYSFKTTNSYSRDMLNYAEGTVKNIHYGDIHTKFSTNFDIENENVPFINSDIDIERIKDENYLQVGDVVFADASEDYADIGKSIEIINLSNLKVVAGLHTLLARYKSDNIATGFIAQQLKTWTSRWQIMRIAQGTKVLGISAGRISKIIIYVPEKEEQVMIADFLSTIDNKIDQLKRKHNLLTQYKKGVVQRLFSQKLRFKSDTGNEFPDWEERRFGDFIHARTESPSNESRYPLYSLTIENGIEPKSARYMREFLVNDVAAAYKVVRPNDFSLNPMNLRFGAIAKHHDNNVVLLSKYYDVFYCDETINSNFFEVYLQSYPMIHFYNRMATGTLEEKKRVHYSEFVNFKKKLPCLAEQKTIAEFLAVLDKKIEFSFQQIKLTQTFKKGLLQQMFI